MFVYVFMNNKIPVILNLKALKKCFSVINTYVFYNSYLESVMYNYYNDNHDQISTMTAIKNKLRNCENEFKQIF